MNTVSKKNKILLGIAGLIFVANCVVLVFAYGSIPNNIVVHSYNGINDYGDKSSLWCSIVLNAVLLIIITIAVVNCQKWMRPTPDLTADERTETIDNARLILAIVAIKVSIVFSIILFK